MDWWIVAVVLGYLAFMGWIIEIVARYRINKSKERSEERLRLLERFGTGRELGEFLESPAGDKLLRVFSVKPADPSSKVAWGFAVGLVLLFLGFGFLILVWLEVFGDADVFLVPGVLVTLAGTAVLISVAVSARLLKAASARDRDGAP